MILDNLSQDIFKQSVKSMAWFVLAAYIRMWEERWMEEETGKQKGTGTWRFEKFSDYPDSAVWKQGQGLS